MHYPLLLYVILIYDFKIKKKNKFYSVQAAKIKRSKDVVEQPNFAQIVQILLIF